ncbi:hypothetical protein [Ichthyobacterium seriolicida]|uniref:Uncharacterized protein n=1 Tax=Ichthyobacterium seriolicida TaxID=242600 RepID=A0A1J1E3W7_9FLAO|nr:hypothetical protein [Ichthyobacterium seriolicida]BAV94740.1 hypothetical protein JBKA6_0727 [Ichthyobacterium seriolicida]
MTKNTEVDSLTTWGSSIKFKADALTLPDGAYIDVTASAFTGTGATDTSTHPVTDPSTAEGFAISTANNGIQFRVVAQDGETATYYKLTFKDSASG